MNFEILPSFLAADLGHLADDLLRAEASGADAIHLDIMDPTFVPNMSFGPSIVDFCRKTAPNFYRNVHLMMNRPDLYLEKFANAGAQTIQIHVEADCDLHTELKRIRALGCKAAIVLNPETPVEILTSYLGEIDEALVMTVHPGYGGQTFIPSTLDKIGRLKAAILATDAAVEIEIDGGVKVDNCQTIIDMGADVLVAGSAIYGSDDIPGTISALHGI